MNYEKVAPFAITGVVFGGITSVASAVFTQSVLFVPAVVLAMVTHRAAFKVGRQVSSERNLANESGDRGEYNKSTLSMT